MVDCSNYSTIWSIPHKNTLHGFFPYEIWKCHSVLSRMCGSLLLIFFAVCCPLSECVSVWVRVNGAFSRENEDDICEQNWANALTIPLIRRWQRQWPINERPPVAVYIFCARTCKVHFLHHPDTHTWLLSKIKSRHRFMTFVDMSNIKRDLIEPSTAIFLIVSWRARQPRDIIITIKCQF